MAAQVHCTISPAPTTSPGPQPHPTFTFDAHAADTCIMQVAMFVVVLQLEGQKTQDISSWDAHCMAEAHNCNICVQPMHACCRAQAHVVV